MSVTPTSDVVRMNYNRARLILQPPLVFCSATQIEARELIELYLEAKALLEKWTDIDRKEILDNYGSRPLEHLQRWELLDLINWLREEDE